ncbi:class I SAM-dependent methyltransferase [Algoriphagus namhaensis]
MADEKELADYYTNYYEKDHYEAVNYKKQMEAHFQRISKMGIAQVLKEARYLKNTVRGGGFLDIGCGLGLGLSYAQVFGCDLYATEFDAGALEFVRSNFDVQTFQGDIWEAGYPDDFFDFIHISHVIEHVSDPRAYLLEMKRIVKKGGFIAIGTPNMSSSLYRLHHWYNFIRFRIPDVIDGLEHTFIFPQSRLRSFCEEEGLHVVDHYTHSLGEKISNLIHYKIPLSKKNQSSNPKFFQCQSVDSFGKMKRCEFSDEKKSESQ